MPPCAAAQFKVYFASDDATINAENFSNDPVDAALAQTHDCGVQQIDLKGHSDGSEASGADPGVSSRRAAAVRDYLIAHGVQRNVITEEDVGFREPPVATQPTDSEPLNRIVEIDINPPPPSRHSEDGALGVFYLEAASPLSVNCAAVTSNFDELINQLPVGAAHGATSGISKIIFRDDTIHFGTWDQTGPNIGITIPDLGLTMRGHRVDEPIGDGLVLQLTSSIGTGTCYFEEGI